MIPSFLCYKCHTVNAMGESQIIHGISTLCPNDTYKRAILTIPSCFTLAVPEAEASSLDVPLPLRGPPLRVSL